MSVDAVCEAVALSGGAVPALRTALVRDPGAGLERALLALAIGADYSDVVLRDQLIRAYVDGRDKSPVPGGVFAHPPALLAGRRSPGCPSWAVSG